jgi:hypothetical protein
VKDDEFYTLMTDIEKELLPSRYAEHFVGKTVFMNCDDPKDSNFWRFFSRDFTQFKLHRMIATHFNDSGKAYMLEMMANGVKEDAPLKQNGDFRSPECIELLKQADIVVTNPPFSLFREYIEQLMQYDKKFLVIGNMNAITYKEVFRHIQNNKLWLGHSIHSGDREFRVPDCMQLRPSVKYRIDPDTGLRIIRVAGVRWFTNLEYTGRRYIADADSTKNKIATGLRYCGNESKYPKYDNYDAINVDKTVDIPMDYPGVMGVPITFLDKYNPDQFEITGYHNGGNKNFTIAGKYHYGRIHIRNRNPEGI